MRCGKKNCGCDACDTSRKCHCYGLWVIFHFFKNFFPVSILLISVIPALFCDIFAIFCKRNIAKYRTKNAVATFSGILKKHPIPVVRYIPRFRYLRAGPEPQHPLMAPKWPFWAIWGPFGPPWPEKRFHCITLDVPGLVPPLFHTVPPVRRHQTCLWHRMANLGNLGPFRASLGAHSAPKWPKLKKVRDGSCSNIT